MKTSVQIIIGAAVFVLLAATVGVCLCHHNTHRGIREMQANEFYRHQGMGQRGMWGKEGKTDMQMRRRGMRPGIEQGMPGMRRGMNQGPMNGMRREGGRGRMNGMERNMGTMPMDSMRGGNFGHDRTMGMMPALTEKQRKEIAELRQKQQEELNKLRREMSSRINNLIQAQRDKVMELLTPEQKNFFESRKVSAEPAPSK
jgi:hypothetical protein